MKTSTCERQPEASKWLSALRYYLACILLANLLWEILQLPLYTIWTEGTPAEIAFAVASPRQYRRHACAPRSGRGDATDNRLPE